MVQDAPTIEARHCFIGEGSRCVYCGAPYEEESAEIPCRSPDTIESLRAELDALRTDRDQWKTIAESGARIELRLHAERDAAIRERDEARRDAKEVYGHLLERTGERFDARTRAARAEDALRAERARYAKLREAVKTAAPDNSGKCSICRQYEESSVYYATFGGTGHAPWCAWPSLRTALAEVEKEVTSK